MGTESHSLVARLALGPVMLPADDYALSVEREQVLVRDRHTGWYGQTDSRVRAGVEPRPIVEGCDTDPQMTECLEIMRAEAYAYLSRLPVEQREVLVLVAVERLAYTEIATILGIPIGTVLARLKDAREAMR